MAMDYREPNFNPAYNNPKFVAIVANRVQKSMGRNLTSAEMSMIANFIRNLDADLLRRLPPNKVLSKLVLSITSRLAQYQCEEEPDSARAYMLEQIGTSGEDVGLKQANPRNALGGEMSTQVDAIDISKIFGQTKPSKIQKILNPKAMLRRNYILMDTRYRSLSNDGTRYFEWNHINNLNRKQGSVNTIGSIRDIVAVRVYPFRIPYAASLDTSYRKISMLIRDFQSQSFVAHEGRRFHFMFDVVIDGDSVYLRPEYNNDAYYRFYQPLTQVDNLSIDFGSPLEDVVFDPDRSQGSVGQYWDGVQTLITTQTPHNLLTGNIVYITNFTSLDSRATALIVSQINKSTGYNVIVSSPTTFKIPVDSSLMTQLIQAGATLNADKVVGVASAVNPGDRLRITNSAAPPFTDYGVFLVKFQDSAGVIYLDQTSGQVGVNCFVFRDYRPPPLTRNDGYEVASTNITLTNSTVVGISTKFISDYRLGDTIDFFNAVASVNEGPYLVTSVISDTQMSINRVAVGTINNLTALKKTQIESNIIQVYYGGKRIFVPIELTYISSE